MTAVAWAVTQAVLVSGRRPGRAGAGFDDEWDGEGGRGFHNGFGECGRGVRVGGGGFEKEFVVDLKKQARVQAGGREFAGQVRTMARLMMSAAPPWRGALMAWRSA